MGAGEKTPRGRASGARESVPAATATSGRGGGGAASPASLPDKYVFHFQRQNRLTRCANKGNLVTVSPENGNQIVRCFPPVLPCGARLNSRGLVQRPAADWPGRACGVRSLLFAGTAAPVPCPGDTMQRATETERQASTGNMRLHRAVSKV